MRVMCLRSCTVGVAYFEASHVYEWPDAIPLNKHFEQIADGTPMQRGDEAVVPNAKGPEPARAPGDPRPEYKGPLTMHEAAQQQGADLQISEADPRTPKGVV